jgi:hypothetical protein
MHKFLTLIILAMTIFFSTIGGDRYESTSSGCSEIGSTRAALASDKAPCSCTHLAPPVAANHAPEAHPCHIGHCAFTFHALSTFTVGTSVAVSQSSRLYSAILSGYLSETLRPPSRA